MMIRRKNSNDNGASDTTPGGSDSGKLEATGLPQVISVRTALYLMGASSLMTVAVVALLLAPTGEVASSTAITGAAAATASSCMISFGEYAGKEFRYYDEDNGGTVGYPDCLVESKFLKLQRHRVRLPGSTRIIPDWLWIDYHDRINVLVQAPPSSAKLYSSSYPKQDDEEVSFYVFEQTKYALEGRRSLAIIGGLVEPSDKDDEQAARREVLEEMNIECNRYVLLGRLRADVNRGLGWLASYLALDCSVVSPTSRTDSGKGNAQADEIGGSDAERQDLRVLRKSDLKGALVDGRFLELPWAATVSFALHYLERPEVAA